MSDVPENPLLEHDKKYLHRNQHHLEQQHYAPTKIRSVAALRILAEEKRILSLECQLVEAELKLRRIDQVMAELSAQIAEDEKRKQERRLLHLEIALVEAQIQMKHVERRMKQVGADVPPDRVTHIVQQVYAQPPPVPVRSDTTKATSATTSCNTSKPTAPHPKPPPLARTAKPRPITGKLAHIINRFEKTIARNEQLGQAKSASCLTNVAITSASTAITANANSSNHNNQRVLPWQRKVLKKQPVVQHIAPANHDKTNINVPLRKQTTPSALPYSSRQLSTKPNYLSLIKKQTNVPTKRNGSFTSSKKNASTMGSSPFSATALDKNEALMDPKEMTITNKDHSKNLTETTVNDEDDEDEYEIEYYDDDENDHNEENSYMDETVKSYMEETIKSYMEDTINGRLPSHLLDSYSYLEEEETIYDEETVVSYTYSLVQRSRKNRPDDEDIESLKSELSSLKQELSSLRRQEIQDEIEAGDEDELLSIQTPTNLLIKATDGRVHSLLQSPRSVSSANRRHGSSGSGMNYSYSTIDSENYLEEILESAGEEEDDEDAKLVEQTVGHIITEQDYDSTSSDSDESDSSGSYVNSDSEESQDDDSDEDDSSFSLSIYGESDISSVGSVDPNESSNDNSVPSKNENVAAQDAPVQHVPARMVSMLDPTRVRGCIVDDEDETEEEDLLGPLPSQHTSSTTSSEMIPVVPNLSYEFEEETVEEEEEGSEYEEFTESTFEEEVAFNMYQCQPILENADQDPDVEEDILGNNDENNTLQKEQCEVPKSITKKEKLPRGMARIPKWWMELVPHFTIELAEDERGQIAQVLYTSTKDDFKDEDEENIDYGYEDHGLAVPNDDDEGSIDYGYEDHAPIEYGYEGNQTRKPQNDDDEGSIEFGYEPQFTRRPTFCPMINEESEDALAMLIKKGRIEAPEKHTCQDDDSESSSEVQEEFWGSRPALNFDIDTIEDENDIIPLLRKGGVDGAEKSPSGGKPKQDNHDGAERTSFSRSLRKSGRQHNTQSLHARFNSSIDDLDADLALQLRQSTKNPRRTHSMDNMHSSSSLNFDENLEMSEDEQEEADRRELYRLAHKKKGFVDVVHEAASLGRLTRLKEHVVEEYGKKSNAPKRSRRASVVATNLLDIQWKTTHHGSVCSELVEMGTMFRGREVITESVHPSKRNLTPFDSGWDNQDSDSECYDEFGGDTIDEEQEEDEGHKMIESVVQRTKQEDREKNARILQHLQNQQLDDVDLPLAPAPRAVSIIRRQQQNPRALRRCSIGTITRTLSQDVIQRHSERQARVDAGQLHMRGQCSCPYCYTASPFQTYAYKKETEQRADAPPPGTWVRQNGKWSRAAR